MKVVRLQMQHQMAQIQVESKRAKLNIESPRRQMDTDFSPARMSVDNQLGSVMLDSTSLRENTARRSIFSLQRQFAAEAVEAAWQGVAETVQTGDALAQQPNPGDVWGSLAQEKMLEVDVPTYGRSTVPQAGVSMSGDGGHCDISWTPHHLEITWDAFERPHVSLEPEPSVAVELAREAQVSCEVVEEEIPSEIGQNIDVSG